MLDNWQRVSYNIVQLVLELEIDKLNFKHHELLYFSLIQFQNNSLLQVNFVWFYLYSKDRVNGTAHIICKFSLARNNCSYHYSCKILKRKIQLLFSNIPVIYCCIIFMLILTRILKTITWSWCWFYQNSLSKSLSAYWKGVLMHEC